MTVQREKPMFDIRVFLSLLWVALALTYLLGDVLRIFAGEFTPGEIGGMELTQGMWLAIAILMSAPIGMVVLSLILPASLNRWANLLVAGFFFVFNLVGLPTYPSAYDRYLILVGLVITVVIGWYAWHWDPRAIHQLGG